MQRNVRKDIIRKVNHLIYFSFSSMLSHISNRIRLSLYLPYTAPLKYQALSIPSNSSNLRISSPLGFVTSSANLQPSDFLFNGRFLPHNSGFYGRVQNRNNDRSGFTFWYLNSVGDYDGSSTFAVFLRKDLTNSQTCVFLFLLG